jgi:hypothetical protein
MTSIKFYNEAERPSTFSLSAPERSGCLQGPHDLLTEESIGVAADMLNGQGRIANVVCHGLDWARVD